MPPELLQMLISASPDAAPLLLAALRKGQMQPPDMAGKIGAGVAPPPFPPGQQYQMSGASIGPGLQRAGMLPHGSDITPSQVTDFPMDMRGIGQRNLQGNPDMMRLMAGGNFPTPTRQPLPGSTGSPMFANAAPAGGTGDKGGTSLGEESSPIPIATPGGMPGETSTGEGSGEGYEVQSGDMASNIARALLGKGASMEQIMALVRAMAGDPRNSGAFMGGSNMQGGREMGFQLRQGAQLHVPMGMDQQRIGGAMNRPWSSGNVYGNQTPPPARTPSDGLPIGSGPTGRINDFGPPPGYFTPAPGSLAPRQRPPMPPGFDENYWAHNR